MKLAGKCALVTGGGSGIGRASAIALAAEGADVAVVDLNMAGARETVASIEQRGRRGLALCADVGKKAEVVAAVDAASAALGKIDILVNCAGVGRNAWLHFMEEEDWDAVMESNAKGTFLCTQAVIAGMIERRYGKIVNVSSLQGKSGNPGTVSYAAAKAAVIGFTKAAAKELAKHNITVNAVLPGYVYTPMTREVPEKVRARHVAQIPLGRIGRPEEPAAAVVFLASDESSYVTGATLEVGGGFLM